MARTDMITKRIFVVALGISMVLSSAALLVFSVSHATAQNNVPPPPQVYNGATGRYGMAAIETGEKGGQPGPGRMGSGNHQISYQVIVWDTETGASRIYYYDAASASYQPTLKQLPQQPLN